MKLGVLILAWVIYFFLHSALASPSVKNQWKKWLGMNYKYYRIGYVLISTVGLFFIFFLNSNIKSPDYFYDKGFARYVSLMFAAFGVIIIKLAFRAYEFSSFIGLTSDEGQLFKATGILKSIRHPIYSGTILIVIGFWFFSPNLPTLVSALCIFGYLPIGIRLEERKLIEEFGDQYLKYKKETPALIPKIF